MNQEFSDSDVIKNPKRIENQDTQEAYMPEYMRRGIHPVFQGTDTLDGEPVSPLNSHVVDNNEYVSFAGPPKAHVTNQNASPDIGDFILMVANKVVSSGSEPDILEEAKLMLYGEHHQFKKPVDIHDIVLLKRVGLKFGVFLDD